MFVNRLWLLDPGALVAEFLRAKRLSMQSDVRDVRVFCLTIGLGLSAWVIIIGTVLGRFKKETGVSPVFELLPSSSV